MKFRGFTLVEVMVVMVIISVLLIGSLSLTVKYSADVQWDRLFNRLEQMFLDVNTYALAGVSSGFEAGMENVVELPIGSALESLEPAEQEPQGRRPDRYHLYFKKGEPVVWYIESQVSGPGKNPENRKIIFQEKRDLEIPSITLEEIFVQDKSLESVLVSWDKPFARLGFYDVSGMGFSGGKLEEEFVMSENLCAEDCWLSLNYMAAGAEKRGIMFDLEKGVYGPSPAR